MPARIIEELASRKQEKIATFLTFESIVAVILAFMPVFIITAQWPLLSRVPLCLAAAMFGYVATIEFRGLPLYEHALWTARGFVRLRLHGALVGPEDLPGAVPVTDADQVLDAHGPIAVVLRRSPPASQAMLATATANPSHVLAEPALANTDTLAA